MVAVIEEIQPSPPSRGPISDLKKTYGTFKPILKKPDDT
jgi:hypothetical protein